MNTHIKKEVLEFLMSQKIGVLSTVSDGKPHGSYIYYVVDENLDIYFTTPASTRKHQNIFSNNRVAFTVGTTKPPKTVQIEGEAEIVVDDNTIKALTALYVDVATENNHYPVPLTKLDWEQGVIMYRIRPTWLKWSNFTDSKKGKEHEVAVVVINN